MEAIEDKYANKTGQENSLKIDPICERNYKFDSLHSIIVGIQKNVTLQLKTPFQPIKNKSIIYQGNYLDNLLERTEYKKICNITYFTDRKEQLVRCAVCLSGW